MLQADKIPPFLIEMRGKCMEISLRLKTIASAVKYRTLADIGTDHGYIPIYLAKKGIIDKAAACDIKKGPLSKASENIKAYGLESIIETRLGSGMSAIKSGEFETAVIAGMGGMLIIDIISYSLDCVKSLKQLILQPQLDVVSVRRFLHTIGFKIDNEEIVFDEKKYYNILSCSLGLDEIYTDIEYQFGRKLIDRKDSILKDSVLHEKNRVENLIMNIAKIENKNRLMADRILELEALLEAYCEVLKCL